MKYDGIKNWFENQLLARPSIKPPTEKTNIDKLINIQQKIGTYIAHQTEISSNKSQENVFAWGT
jgi:hypothetical protein